MHGTVALSLSREISKIQYLDGVISRILWEKLNKNVSSRKILVLQGNKYLKNRSPCNFLLDKLKRKIFTRYAQW